MTIDGTGQAAVTGTAGNDVIAASLGSTVTALAGDDTICVLPGTATTADVRSTPARATTRSTPPRSRRRTVTTTWAGDDTYRRRRSDQVSTGAGADTVAHRRRQRRRRQRHRRPAQRRQARPRRRGRRARLARTRPAAAVDFGDGANTLVDSDGGVVAINATTRKLDRNGASVLKWNGTVTTYVVDSTATSVAFTGTNGAETFVLRDPATGATPTTVAVDMAGGDDTITIRSNVLDGSTWTRRRRHGPVPGRLRLQGAAPRPPERPVRDRARPT